MEKLHHSTKDLTNQGFGRLAAVRPTKKRASGSIIWECLCICGKTCFVSTRDLRSNDTKSCGCLQKEKVKARLLTHGLSNHAAYQSWWNMFDRCYNSNCKEYNRTIAVGQQGKNNLQILEIYDGSEHGKKIKCFS